MASVNSRNLLSGTNDIDKAIVRYANENGVSEMLQYSLVTYFPFTFIRRKSSVIVRKEGETPVLVTKGALPEVLSVSGYYKGEDGKRHKLDQEAYDRFIRKMEAYSKDGLRTLAISYRRLDEKEEYNEGEEHDLVFAGFVLFTDPVKPSAKQTIMEMHEYGIDVKVLTGDNEYVAKNICDQLDIPTSNMLIGSEIESMSEEELRSRVEDVSLFARLAPKDKESVVTALRANGHVVGVMGDGTNDTPAMKAADVSICVDTGTDIAKDVANMILMEQDLKVVKDGAIEGRRVFFSTMNYVKLITAINFGYALSLSLSSVVFNFEPMGALMILIFNILMDVANLFLPWDNCDDEFIRTPTKWNGSHLRGIYLSIGVLAFICDSLTWLFIIFVAMPPEMSYFSQGILNYTDYFGTPEETLFQTMWFLGSIWIQPWLIHVVRTNKFPFIQSMPGRLILIGTVFSLAVGTLLPFTGDLWVIICNGIAPAVPIPWIMLVWLPIDAAIFFFLSHVWKEISIKRKGYFV